jgi:hypothetical protein
METHHCTLLCDSPKSSCIPTQSVQPLRILFSEHSAKFLLRLHGVREHQSVSSSL